MLTSGMAFPISDAIHTVTLRRCGLGIGVRGARPVQSARDQSGRARSPTILDRINAMLSGGKSAWTREQIQTMERLRDAAMKDPMR